MEPYEKVKQIKDRYTDQLMKKANVVGVGIGLAVRNGVRTDELSIVVMVRQKVPWKKLDEDDIIPQEIEGVKVDVQPVGDVHAME
ncbi:MAG: hypothetical protein P8046_01470 [Anaerolineales bacterium]|jgi:hypothetical protein